MASSGPTDTSFSAPHAKATPIPIPLTEEKTSRRNKELTGSRGEGTWGFLRVVHDSVSLINARVPKHKSVCASDGRVTGRRGGGQHSRRIASATQTVTRTALYRCCYPTGYTAHTQTQTHSKSTFLQRTKMACGTIARRAMAITAFTLSHALKQRRRSFPLSIHRSFATSLCSPKEAPAQFMASGPWLRSIAPPTLHTRGEHGSDFKDYRCSHWRNRASDICLFVMTHHASGIPSPRGGVAQTEHKKRRTTVRCPSRATD
jgi:hypothetical protein